MSDQKYYVRFRGRTLGPFDETKVRELIKRGQVTRMHEISPDGLSWQPAESFAELFDPAADRSTSPQAAAQVEPDNATPQPRAENADWYAHLNDEQKGPVTKNQIGQWVASGAITPQTLVWKDGNKSWEAAMVAIPEFFTTASFDSVQMSQAGVQQGEMKNCPFCTQVINSTAVKCPHCQSMLNTFCSNCGSQCAENQAACLKCGTALGNANEPVIITQPTNEVQVYDANVIKSQSTNLSTTSIVLSVIGLFCFGIILCPIALVLAIVAMNKGEKNAVAALIVSIVIFIPSVFWFLFVVGSL